MDKADDNIRIATNIPGLRDKITANIKNGKDTIYWYIQFNVPLDESTVNQKTMGITDTSGYIMRTDITYMKEKNTIVISPLDSYEQNVYYLLNISKKVKSASGKRMRTQIHILFKLLNNQISEYKILKSNVEVPKPKKRPPDYDKTRTRIYSFDESVFSKTDRDKLPADKFTVNIVPGILGLAVTASYVYFRLVPVLVAGLLIYMAGMAIIAIQMRKPALRSVMAYNKGTRRFNGERYQEAEVYFKKALSLNPENEMAEYALNKLSYYK